MRKLYMVLTGNVKRRYLFAEGTDIWEGRELFELDLRETEARDVNWIYLYI
jgi:hypothetical protein